MKLEYSVITLQLNDTKEIKVPLILNHMEVCFFESFIKDIFEIKDEVIMYQWGTGGYAELNDGSYLLAEPNEKYVFYTEEYLHSKNIIPDYPHKAEQKT